MMEQQQKLQVIFKKYDEANQRYLNNLEERRRKAKIENEKAREVQLIQVMEKQQMKFELDEKYLESQERRIHLERQAFEKLQNRKIKEDEVRRKKRENEEERVNKLKQSQQKREHQRPHEIVKKQTRRIPDLDILLDIMDDSCSLERRQFRSLSPSFRPLEREQIVFFNLEKKKPEEKKRKNKKQKKHVLQKAYRDASLPQSYFKQYLPVLIRPYEIQSPRATKDTESNNVTPKKEEEFQTQNYRLCLICNIILEEIENDNNHLQSNRHKQTKLYYGLTSTQGDIMMIKGTKEDLSNHRFTAIRRRSNKIRQKIQQKSLQMEHLNLYTYREPQNKIQNKQLIQKLTNELDKLMNNQIKDLSQIEMQLQALRKLFNQDPELIHLRQMKFIQIIVESFKKVPTCRKHEYPQFLKIIEIATEIVYHFCSVSNNRTYFVISNKLLPLIDFMYNFLATKPTKFIYSFQFVAQFFQIFSLLIKHKLPNDPLADGKINEIQEDTIEYFFCCGLFHKMKMRFLSFEKDYINSEGKIPVALVKSVAFMEAITNYHGFDTQSKSIFEQSTKISKNLLKHINFVLEETELFGLIPLISQMLVGEGVCLKTNKLLPQTTISFLMVAIKTLNNIARINLMVFQNVMLNEQNRQETLMIMQSLLSYCKINLELCQDLKDLLNEVILMIGYFCVLNPMNQHSLVGSMKSISILHNLTQMPTSYFIDKNLKNVLLPTLLCTVFKSPQNLQIVLDEMDKSYLLELLTQDEEQQGYQGLLQRSPSMSSTNSQNSTFPYSSPVYFRFTSRFPIQCLQEAITQINEFKE